LARRLLAQPEAWMQQSSLVKERAEALPADTPSRDWSRQVVDVEDVQDVQDIQDSADIQPPSPTSTPSTPSTPLSTPPPSDTHDEL
jgi:hypothetical protein